MRLSFANGLFWSSVACCLIAQLFILRSVLGARHVRGTAAELPRARVSVEVVWAVLPAIALAMLLLFTWRAVQQHEQRSMAPVAQAAP